MKKLPKYATRNLHTQTRICPNCKETLRWNQPGHFVPPSLNEEGYFICKKVR